MKLYCIYFERAINRALEREISEYKKRVSKRFHILEYHLKEESKRGPEEQVKKIIDNIHNCTVCLLESAGEEMDSLAFAKFVGAQEMSGRGLLFIIGPHNGFSRHSMFHKDYIISLSKMTFSHRIARLMLYEQIYRAFCIFTRHPYHK